MTESPRTKSAPTGTSPRARAAVACSSATRMKPSSRPPSAGRFMRSRCWWRGRCRWRWQEQGGIHEHGVERNTKVQVRSGDAAGSADLAEHRACLQHFPGVHLDLAQVAVHGEEAAAVIENDRVAVEEVVAGIEHAAIGRRMNGRAALGGNIHP